MVSLNYEKRSTSRQSVKKLPSRSLRRILFLFFLTVLSVWSIWFFLPTLHSSIEEKYVIWVKHPQHSDPVKVRVPYNSDIADVKKMVKSELQPALDKESLGNVVILSPKLGRLNPRTLVRKVNLDKSEHLIVFVDNVDSRLFLKTLTSDQLPLQVNAPLCLKSDEAYMVIAKVLMGQYSQKDIIALKNNLCDSSVESWSSRYSYTGR
ncbi:11650_t:CDS:2 [Acaulospora morrowiae]|uniref:11650_t:CDS:1 n=1 Tax=Acaulospora morrowiae TaxID=94023 RepID=A0A9N8Z7M3_9GLOM|nr:11650_t:CDS:2 [Acaulospora morrowiae]